MVNDFRKRGDKATIPGTEIYFLFFSGENSYIQFKHNF